MTPDPVFDKLVRFSPDAGGVDPAAILFRAGQASARTPWVWKLAVAGLLVVSISMAGALAFHEQRIPAAGAPGAPEVVPVIVVVPVPTAEPASSPSPSEPLSPWSLGALHAADPDDLPALQPVSGMAPADHPLTPRSQGEID